MRKTICLVAFAALVLGVRASGAAGEADVPAKAKASAAQAKIVKQRAKAGHTASVHATVPRAPQVPATKIPAKATRSAEISAQDF
jgi:hypothetical protein